MCNQRATPRIRFPQSIHVFLRTFSSSQEFAPVESSVTVKLKGTSRSHLPENDSDVSSQIPREWRHLYNRVWDVADYVVPPAENGAFFITTNVVLTPNQTQTACPEDPSVKEVL